MKTKFVIGLLILFLATCSVKNPTPRDSGIAGQVLVGPMCPVVQQGQKCPDQPYQATLIVNSLDGRKIVQFQTDETGRFKISLAPGEYILHPEAPNVTPFASEKSLTVETGKYAQIIVNYDSGIR